MTLIIADRVKQVSLTTGSGSITFAETIPGFRSFSSAIGSGNQTYYAIENDARWEVGVGTYNGSQLTRDTVFTSSANGAKINLEGTSRVFCTYTADRSVHRGVNNVVDLSSYNGIELSGVSITSSGVSLEDVTISGQLILEPFNNEVPTFIRVSAGCFFHAYNDDAYDRTVALHTDSAVSPTWKLGLKNSPSDYSAAPTFGYVYGADGVVGLVGNSNNSIVLDASNNFRLKHQNVNILTASYVTGIHINSPANNFPALTVNGGPSLTDNIQEWVTYGGSVLSVLDKNGRLAIKKTSASYDLDVDGSGSFDYLHINSGVIFNDGGTQKLSADSIKTNSDAATITFDMNKARIHTVVLGGNRVLALDNVDVGQRFTIRLTQDSTGNRTVTWFNNINWPNGSIPSLTPSGGKTDVFDFICTSGGFYDGFTLGQNL